jgi:hypothetical protein
MTDLDSGSDLHDLMDRALTDLPTPVARLRDGATRQGRSLRRRRRTITAVAGTAVLAAAVAVVVPVLGGTGPRPGGVAVDPASSQPQPFVAHPGWWDAPVGEMRKRLVGLLPEDVTIAGYDRTNTEHAPGESSDWSGVFTGALRDASDVGPGGVEIMLTELPQDPTALADLRAQHLSCDLDDWTFVDLEGRVQCEVGDLRGGRPYERTITFTDQGVTYSEVRRWVGDGEVYAAVSNSTERKWGPPASAARPPLSLPELVAIVENPSWTE